MPFLQHVRVDRRYYERTPVPLVNVGSAVPDPAWAEKTISLMSRADRSMEA